MSKRYALLVGISRYGEGLQPIPSALLDVEKMAEVLLDPELGGIEDPNLQVLRDPGRTELASAIESFYADKEANDLLVLYFSGHGFRDDDRQLLLSSAESKKVQPDGKIRVQRATTLTAAEVRGFMERSRCKRQVVILDCCFSGAFAEGLMAKDEGPMEIEGMLGGKGRAILTSSDAIETSRAPEDGDGLSVYTRFLVEGIQTGAADRSGRGWLDPEDLHLYAKSRVLEVAPSMTPQFFPTREGHSIRVCRVRREPSVAYRQKVQELAESRRGKISTAGLEILADLAGELGLTAETAGQIEEEVLQPFRDYSAKLERYRLAAKATLEAGGSQANGLSSQDREELKELEQRLKLRPEDVEALHNKLEIKEEGQAEHLSRAPSTAPSSSPGEATSRVQMWISERSRSRPLIEEADRIRALIQGPGRPGSPSGGLPTASVSEPGAPGKTNLSRSAGGAERIYEVSRDLGLDIRDVLAAAEKLSIPARSHSSSISHEEAVRIRALIRRQGVPSGGPTTASASATVAPGKTILSVKKALSQPPAHSASSTPLIQIPVTKGWMVREGNQWQKKEAPIRVKGFREELAKGIAITMIQIPEGQFLMGAPDHEAGSSFLERPQRIVKLKGFFMSQTPVTQAQWRIVASWPRIEMELEQDPSCFKGINRPVEQVNWLEAMEFCRRMSHRSRISYILPSEAQWEYACRAGTLTPFSYGETLTSDFANYDGTSPYPDISGSVGIKRGETVDAASFLGNDWGLQDMHGGVWEWCLDSYQQTAYETAPADGSAFYASARGLKVVRGGSWVNTSVDCRSAARRSLHLDESESISGFRLVSVPHSSIPDASS
jgi:formylglycine-generating enzyme required for sulfatase activity